MKQNQPQKTPKQTLTAPPWSCRLEIDVAKQNDGTEGGSFKGVLLPWNIGWVPWVAHELGVRGPPRASVPAE